MVGRMGLKDGWACCLNRGEALAKISNLVGLKHNLFDMFHDLCCWIEMDGWMGLMDGWACSLNRSSSQNEKSCGPETHAFYIFC